MTYTPRRIAAWLEVMDRINSFNTAARITEMQAANADPKEVRSHLKKMREQL